MAGRKGLVLGQKAVHAQGLTQAQVQKLALTPTMRQSLLVLQMSSMDLETYLSEQVMENPLIDLDAFQERSETTWRVRDEGDDPFGRATEPFTFQDHLKEQIPFFDLEKNVETLCRYMIECLDARGYLPKPIVERCLEDPRIEPIARKAIGTLRAMDPVGVGACGLEECLVLQLKAMGHDYDLTYEIVNGHLDELARNQLGSIARACNVRRGDVDASVRVIRRLSPIPSRGFNVLNDAVRVKPEATLIPDERGGVEVVLASSWSEAIRIDERLASRLDEGATQGTCGKWLEGAKSLKNVLHQRETTVASVIRAVAAHQVEAVSEGVDAVVPLTMDVIARELGVSESTVSRAVRDKWVLMPCGMVELKSLFSSVAYEQRSNMSSGHISAESVQARMRELIDCEDPGKPLSDQKLTDILVSEGVNLSRRVVAKYRSAMGIPVASVRKAVAAG